MPIHLLWGDEDFNIEEKIKEFKKTILKDDINPLNYRKIDNPSFVKLEEILRTQGMMFGDILFIINANKYFINEGKASFITEKETDEIVKCIQELPSSIHVVFVCKVEPESNKKPDSRKKLYKAVDKYGTIENFPMFKPWETQKAVIWVKNRAKKLKLEISQENAEKLIMNVGMSLRALNNNLEKLALLAHPNNVITEKILNSIVFDNADVFKVTDLIVQGNFVKALSEIIKLTEKKEPLAIMAVLQTAITKLLQIKIYETKFPPSEISRKIGQHEFVVKQNAKKVQNVSTKELVRLKQNLTEIEFKIKTGQISDPLLAFELALIGDKRL
ncbi:MAG: DNA polymerase III subunit delta [Cyanobacteria bacterium SIG30]|nr:DNA polymerase III subunit delta [Cyanobacteria bacterium SIG30]